MLVVSSLPPEVVNPTAVVTVVSESASSSGPAQATSPARPRLITQRAWLEGVRR